MEVTNPLCFGCVLEGNVEKRVFRLVGGKSLFRGLEKKETQRRAREQRKYGIGWKEERQSLSLLGSLVCESRQW